MITCVYRISDKSYDKTKLFGGTKETCLNNFLKAFSGCKIVIADNCTNATVQLLKNKELQVIETSLGNAGSARKAFLDATTFLGPDEIVYFAEDDYLYDSRIGDYLYDSRVRCSALLEEGLTKASYATLYDHPDKYQQEYNFGEITKVVHTKSSHWRYTISTTMTFATKISTLSEDIDIWKKHTEGQHPNDHLAFCELAKKNRSLVTCIPGVACHIDLTYSAMKKQVLIEDWAIKMMEQSLFEEMSDETKNKYQKIADLEPSLQKLAMMSQLIG